MAQNQRGPEPDCHQLAAKFAAHPNQSSLDKISGPANAKCWEQIDSSNLLLAKLNNWTKNGNEWTARYLAEHLRNLDGGNLEDALIALGEFSERDMQRLLSFAHDGILSTQELDNALTMLPLSLSDNAPAQLRCLKLRRRKASSVTTIELSEQKARAIASIDNFISEVKRDNP